MRRAAAAAVVALCAFAAAACDGHTNAKPSDSADAPRRVATDSAPTAAESPASTPEFFSAAELSRVADALSHGSTTARTVAAHPEYHWVEARRVRDGTPEVHDDWSDLTYVQSGRARLLAGGRLTGGGVVSPGEHRGGTIAGGVSHAIASGDFFAIPPGVPHQYLIAPGDSIRYLTIKVPRARQAAAPR